MRLAWHIVKKDFRLLRWTLLALIVLSIIAAINQVIAPLLIDGHLRWHRALPFWIFVTSVAYGLVPLLAVANQIQAEGLMGTTAFWLTRPISRGTLLRSKLLGLALFFALPLIVVDGVLMAAFGVSASTLVLVAIQEACVIAVLWLVIAFAASVTTSAVRLLGLLVGLFVVVSATTTIAIGLMMPAIDRTPFGSEVILVPIDPTQAILFNTAVAAVALGALWYHYSRRRRARAVLLFLAGLALSWALTGLVGPHTSLFGGPPTVAHERWAQDGTEPHLRISADRPTKRSEQRAAMSGDGDGDWIDSIVMPVAIDGLPAEYSARPSTVAAEVRFADGHVVRSQPSGPYHMRLPIVPGVSVPGPRDYVREEFWPVLMKAPRAVFEQDGDRPGDYTGTFDYSLERHETLAVMPLARDARYNDGTRSVLVTDTRYESDHCLATVRLTRVDLAVNASSRPVLAPQFRLRDGTPLTWVAAPRRNTLVAASGEPVFDLLPHPLRQFEIEYREMLVLYPMLEAYTAPGPPCDQIEVVMERTSYAGVLTRTLTLHDFRLNDAEPPAQRQPPSASVR
jgi:hypothetical protein